MNMGISGGPNIEEFKANKDVKGLINALKDKDINVRGDAAEALGKIGDSRAVEPLIEALKDIVEFIAIESLRKIGEPAIDPLIKALKNKDTLIRSGAARALGEIRDKRAIEPLTEAIKYGDMFVRSAAVGALEKIKGL
jgi:HEAT repeat protein